MSAVFAVLNVTGERTDSDARGGASRRYGIVLSLHQSQRDADRAVEALQRKGVDAGELDLRADQRSGENPPKVGDRLPFWGSP